MTKVMPWHGTSFRAFPTLALAALLLGAALLPACTSADTADLDGDLAANRPPRHPKPTQHLLDPDAEARNKIARKAWFAERHRAAPDVDWKAIERENGDAQRKKRNQLSSMAATASRWTEIGSKNQAGRMHVAAPSPDGQTLYAGSSLGGVWRATMDGQNWTPMGDNIYGGAHWLAVAPGATPSDPEVVLRATDGGLIHVTRDDGDTWDVPSGIPATVMNVRRVQVSADGTHTVFLVLHYLTTGGTARHGLFRSTDAALTFAPVFNFGTYNGDVWMSRTGASSIWALKNDNVFRSDDGGDNFAIVGALPGSSSGCELTGSEAGAPRLYAVLDESGTRKLYRSDDAGASWVFKTNVSDYWGSLSASITNPDLFVWGGVEVWRSTNGGNSFDKVNAWWEYYDFPATKLHADIPGIDVIPDGLGGEIWYVSTDGGLFRSTDGLASVENLSLNGLRVSQYYTTHTSNLNPLHIVAGAQDQGYQWADQPAAGPDALVDFDQLISGDYGHATSGDGSHRWLYSVYPGFTLVQRYENNPALFTTNFPSGEDHGWLPMIVADPLDNEVFYFCAEHLWRHENIGIPASPNFNSTIWSTEDFGASSGEYLSAMVFSPVDPNRAYGATSQGRLFTSDDHGVNWTESADTGPTPHYFYGTALVASSTDKDTAWVAGSGYSVAGVRKTTDGGATWQTWDTGIGQTLVYDMAEATDGSGTMFAATERSAWKRAPGDASWTDITSNEAPVTIYWSVEGVASSNVMRFGTYGRGIWDYALDDPCSYEAYGLGLGGINTMLLDSSSPTTLGTTHTLEITSGPATASGSLLFSPGTTSLAFKGGTLLVDPTFLIQIPFATDGAGAASIPLLIPGDPLLDGLVLNFQAAVGPPEGWALSNGLTGILCE
jgi:hypothetical protein